MVRVMYCLILPSSLEKSYPPKTPNCSKSSMSLNILTIESFIGTKSAPLVTAEDNVSLSMFTTTNPGSRVTVSLSKAAGNARAFCIGPVPTPPIPCMPSTNLGST